MARYTKQDADGRYYIESVNGKLESNIFGHTYGEAIDRFAELENADVAPKSEVAREIFEEIDQLFDLVCHMIGVEIISFPQYAELKKKYTEEKE